MKCVWKRLFFFLFCLLIMISGSASATENAEETVWEKYDMFHEMDVCEKTMSRQVLKHFWEDSYASPDGSDFSDPYQADFMDYVLEYHATESFLEALKGNKPFTENEFSSDASIYFPVSATINGKDRVFGHVEFRPDGSNEEYLSSILRYSVATEEFQRGEYLHFLEDIYTKEKIDSLMAEKNISNIENIILLRLLGPMNDTDGKILLLKTADGIYVYDITNTAHVKNGDKTLYRAEEYAELREKYEKGNHINGVPSTFAVFASLLIVLILKEHRKKQVTVGNIFMDISDETHQ